MFKAIFLDIDGCLNSELYYRKVPQTSRGPKVDNVSFWAEDIDSESIEMLNTLIEKTAAKVIVSSTWRNKGLPLLQKILEYKGFKYQLFDTTPYGGQGTLRGNEILMWIEAHKELCGHRHEFNRYVILDDDSDMLYWQKDNFLLVDGYVGITPRIVYKAIRILNRE